MEWIQSAALLIFLSDRLLLKETVFFLSRPARDPSWRRAEEKQRVRRKKERYRYTGEEGEMKGREKNEIKPIKIHIGGEKDQGSFGGLFFALQDYFCLGIINKSFFPYSKEMSQD